MNESGWKEDYWYDLRKDYGLLEGGPYPDVKTVAERAVALANERDTETGKPINSVVSITSTRWPGDLGSVEVSLADNVESVKRRVREVDDQL